jgi:hypothetical protein
VKVPPLSQSFAASDPIELTGIIVAISAPTALAIQTAESSGITASPGAANSRFPAPQTGLLFTDGARIVLIEATEQEFSAKGDQGCPVPPAEPYIWPVAKLGHPAFQKN